MPDLDSKTMRENFGGDRCRKLNFLQSRKINQEMSTKRFASFLLQSSSLSKSSARHARLLSALQPRAIKSVSLTHRVSLHLRHVFYWEMLRDTYLRFDCHRIRQLARLMGTQIFFLPQMYISYYLETSFIYLERLGN